MAVLRSVAKTDSFEKQRQIINLIGQDLLDLTTATGAGAFSLSDGTVSSPGLFFTNSTNTGIYRGQGKSLNITSDGIGVASFTSTSFTSLLPIKTLSSTVELGTGGITISSAGSGYSGGTYPNVPFTGGSGRDLRGTVEVNAFTGDITNAGSGYVEGNYTDITMTAAGGTAVVDIVVEGIEVFTTNIGTGGTQTGTYSNVPLTGGTGSGATATILVLSSTDGGGNTDIIVSQVSDVDLGNGLYLVNDVLSANPPDIGGVTGFQLRLDKVNRIESVTPKSISPTSLSAGTTFTVNNADLGGSGSNFLYTLDIVGAVTSVDISNGGKAYQTGETLNVRAYELYPTVTKYLKLKQSQLIEFTGTLPTSGFNVGSTVTHDGFTSIVTRKYESGGNIEAIIVDQETQGAIPFNPGAPTITDGTATATIDSVQSALNYYFADIPAPLPQDEYTAWTHLPDITFRENERYVFIQLNDTAAGAQTNNEPHPLRFSTTADGFHTNGGEVLNGNPDVNLLIDYQYEYPDAEHAVEVIVTSAVPTTLYYFCGAGSADPLVEHIDEGGFDGREAVITKSGSILASLGSGFSLTLGSVDETESVNIDPTGAATFDGALIADSGNFVNGITSTYGAAISGNPLTVADKFSVDNLTGNTLIEGTLTVNDELFFTSSATFGGTLYIDSVNNKVSVNRDPAVTPLVEDFEVDGSASIDGNVKLASDSGTYVAIGGSGGTQALDVAGSAIVSGQYIAPTTGVISTPVYTFGGYEKLGLSANPSNKAVSITGESGELIRFEPIKSSSFRDFVTYKREITATSISSPGEGYTSGTYSGVTSSGGTGDGLDADITVAFSVPIGRISTLGTVTTSVDPLRLAGTYNKVPYTTNGSGIDAKFNVVIDGTGAVSSVSLVSGELTSFTNLTNVVSTDPLNSYSGVSGTSSGSGSGATFNISRNISGVATVTLNDSGQGYAINDTITILGSNIGGIDVTNDLTITVTGITAGGGLGYAINDVITVAGTVFGDGTTTPADVTFQVSNLVGILGAGYTDNEYTNVPLITDGSGVGAVASITITGGAVSAIAITSEGSGGYVPGDEITFDHNSLLDATTGNPSSAPTLAAQLFVGALGTVQVVDIIDNGFGYVNGDVLTFPLLPGTPTSTFTLTIGAVTETEVIKLETNTGLATTESLKTKSINVNDKISIADSTITNQASEDITISPGGSTKLLRVTGTGGVKLPVGTSTNRPSASTLGVIRYNSSTQQYEGSNGSDFISLGGVRDVDGNTYILAEETVGANDNILYFYNDAVNTCRFNKTNIELVTNNTIESVGTDGKTLWKDGISVVLNEQVYTDEYIYEVTVAGTTASNPPTHTSGALDDGNGVEFTFVGSVYQPLTFKASNITFDATLTLGALESYSYNNVSSVLETGLNNIEFAFGKIGGAPNTSFTLSDDGSLRVNRSFDTSNAVSNLEVLDYTAKFLELDDVVIKTQDIPLQKGATESGNFVVYNATEGKSSKITVTAENTTTNDIHTTEIQILAKGTDIFTTEYSSLNTGQEQFTYSLSFTPGGEVQIQYTLDSALTTGDAVVITSLATTIKK